MSMTLKQMMAPVRKFDIEDVLDAIGLERKRSVFSVVAPAIGYIVAGVAIGAGIGLLFAPGGRKIRENVQHRIEGMKEKFTANSHGTSMRDQVPVDMSSRTF